MKFDPTVEKKIEMQWVPIESVEPNDWNPNEMTPEQFNDLVAAICSEGFVSPPVVRNYEGKLQVIDGDHRRRALLFLRDHSGDLKEDVRTFYTLNTSLRMMIQRGEMPVINLGEVDRDTAIRLGVQLNRIGGTDNLEILAENLKDIKSHSSLEDMANRLPYTLDKLKEMVGNMPKPEPQSKNTSAPTEPPQDEEWIKYTMRFPKACKEIIDSEFARIGEILGYPVDVEELTAIQMGLILEKVCVLSADTPTNSLQ
jgi:hypothetical protein